MRQFAFAYTESNLFPNLEELSIENCACELRKCFAHDHDRYKVDDDTKKSSIEVDGYYFPRNLKIIIRGSDLSKDTLWSTHGISIQLEAPITACNKRTFENSSITELILPEDIKECPTLEYCPNLTHVSFKGVENLPDELFAGCHTLQKVELPFSGPGSATSTGNFGALFGKESAEGLRPVVQFFENGTSETYYIPSSLKELVLAEGCEMIPYGGLYNCNMLESITLPTSLYMVGEKALFGCAKIGHIYCKGADPAVAYDSSFEGMRISSCKLHVPYNTAELYKRSSGWKNFYYFEEEAPLHISVTKTIENAGVIYGLNEYRPGQTAELKAVANSGYTFRGWMENGTTLTTSDIYSFIVTDSRNLIAVFTPVLDENTIETIPTAEGATFNYSSIEGTTSYLLEIYKDENMTEPVKSITSPISETQQARAIAENRTISVNGLEAETLYFYSIKALTGENIVLAQFTGSFTTAETNSIDNFSPDEETAEPEHYDMAGRRISPSAKGIHIIRYSDGSMRKVILK